MESVSNVGVLDKAIGVLHAVEREGPQTLVDLQAITGLPRATLHRLAVARGSPVAAVSSASPLGPERSSARSTATALSSTPTFDTLSICQEYYLRS